MNDKNKKYSIWQLFRADYKSTLAPGKFLMILVQSSIFAIVSIISTISAPSVDQEIIQVSMTFSATMFILSRASRLMYEKQTRDKNKIKFLHFSKDAVALVAYTLEMIIFSIFYLIFAVLSVTVFMIVKTEVKIDALLLIRDLVVLWMVQLLIYSFIYLSSRFIMGFFDSEAKRGFFIFLFSILVELPLLIMNATPYTSLLHSSGNVITGQFQSETIFNQHQLIVSFIPLLNLGLLPGLGVTTASGPQLDHNWYAIIPLIELLIASVFVFKVHSKYMKIYLI